MSNPKIMVICCTCGRHTCMERSVKFFMDQDYPAKDRSMLIFQNSEISQNLSIRVDGNVKIVNEYIDSNTGATFRSLGAIYNATLRHVPEDVDIISFWDDDDIFLPNHISEGVGGWLRALSLNKIAYKPAKSYYRAPEGIYLMSNTLEPSIFVSSSHIKENGFSLETTEQHLQWLNPLIVKQQIFVDPTGIPTLVYNWGDLDIPTFKTSGDFKNPSNFDNYRANSQDHGDRVITPITKERATLYYDTIKALQDVQ